MLEALITFLLSVTEGMGYFGIYFYMVMVGTFVPVPSELVLVPAGYLASQGQMNYWLLLLSGSLGSLSGALINYFFAKLIIKKLLSHKVGFIEKVTNFFDAHGKISVFVAPLTPGLGQYISLPAGISHMPLRFFIPFTYAANIIWVGFMLAVGHMFGKNPDDAHGIVVEGTLFLFGLAILTAILYVTLTFRRKSQNS
ncbi:MAG: DedA family protein [Helicobacteraceae bacterium]|jgi:membrane protein DedA with SNARE-associated domain|nr:DedA family protein [Helicobacteraceae bacterium]